MILLFPLRSDTDGKIELFGKCVPLVNGSSCIMLPGLVLLVGNIDCISMAVGHAIASDKQGAQVQGYCLGLYSFILDGDGFKIDLKQLPYFLLEGHCLGDLVGLLVKGLVYSCGCYGDKCKEEWEVHIYQWQRYLINYSKTILIFLTLTTSSFLCSFVAEYKYSDLGERSLFDGLGQ